MLMATVWLAKFESNSYQNYPLIYGRQRPQHPNGIMRMLIAFWGFILRKLDRYKMFHFYFDDATMTFYLYIGENEIYWWSRFGVRDLVNVAKVVFEVPNHRAFMLNFKYEMISEEVYVPKWAMPYLKEGLAKALHLVVAQFDADEIETIMFRNRDSGVLVERATA